MQSFMLSTAFNLQPQATDVIPANRKELPRNERQSQEATSHSVRHGGTAPWAIFKNGTWLPSGALSAICPLQAGSPASS